MRFLPLLLLTAALVGCDQNEAGPVPVTGDFIGEVPSGEGYTLYEVAFRGIEDSGGTLTADVDPEPRGRLICRNPDTQPGEAGLVSAAIFGVTGSARVGDNGLTQVRLVGDTGVGAEGVEEITFEGVTADGDSLVGLVTGPDLCRNRVFAPVEIVLRRAP